MWIRNTILARRELTVTQTLQYGTRCYSPAEMPCTPSGPARSCAEWSILGLLHHFLNFSKCSTSPNVPPLYMQQYKLLNPIKNDLQVRQWKTIFLKMALCRFLKKHETYVIFIKRRRSQTCWKLKNLIQVAITQDCSVLGHPILKMGTLQDYIFQL